MKVLHTSYLLRVASEELTQEKQRLFGMLRTMLLAAAFLVCSLLSISALLVIAFWETPYRLQSLSVLTVLYLGGTLLAWRRFETLERQGERSMEKTRQELADTLQRMDNKMDSRSIAYPQSVTMQLLSQEPGLIVFLVTELLPSLLRKFSERRAKRRHATERE